MLFLGNVALFFVVQGQIITRIFLAWELTGKESSLAMTSLAVAIPLVLASTISGAIADRVDRRLLIIAGQFVLLVNEFLILALLWLDALQFWHLLFASFVAGCSFPFIMPARVAIIFDIVGREYFSNAMALANGVINLSRVAGPAVFGVVLDIFNATTAYGLAVAMYIVSLICIFAVHPNQPRHPPEKPLFQDVVEGFRYAYHHKAMMVCILFGLLPLSLSMPVQNMLVVFSDQVWHVGERGFGILVAASGFGGLLGSMWVAGRGNRTNRVGVMTGSALAFAVLLLVFSLSPVFSFAIFALVLANIFVSASQTLNNTVTMLLADEKVRGRVSGLMGVSFGLTPLGVLPLAFAAESFGVAYAVAGACVLLFVLVAAFYLLSPVLRNMDSFVLTATNEAQK